MIKTEGGDRRRASAELLTRFEAELLLLLFEEVDDDDDDDNDNDAAVLGATVWLDFAEETEAETKVAVAVEFSTSICGEYANFEDEGQFVGEVSSLEVKSAVVVAGYDVVSS
ncbi:MAG: hypothetical protein M1830_002286 [Pleopsidium flavum]|nr:MAG: hypothetical protein M1830_002286 [Pleopsidium flavum]